jgi:hypothetical protein
MAQPYRRRQHRESIHQVFRRSRGWPGVPPLHAAAGAEYGEGFAGNAHRHAPNVAASVKYLVGGNRRRRQHAR